jgi:hypothetical protein
MILRTRGQLLCKNATIWVSQVIRMDDEVLRKCAPRKRKDMFLPQKHLREDEGCGTGDAQPRRVRGLLHRPFLVPLVLGKLLVDSAPKVRSLAFSFGTVHELRFSALEHPCLLPIVSIHASTLQPKTGCQQPYSPCMILSIAVRCRNKT